MKSYKNSILEGLSRSQRKAKQNHSEIPPQRQGEGWEDMVKERKGWGRITSSNHICKSHPETYYYISFIYAYMERGREPERELIGIIRHRR